MPLTPVHCRQCGALVETRTLDGRAREVCPACATVHYRNPLPVAAALVLDAQRRVLLVKRSKDPYRDMWCLPIGFAELDEGIDHAALRELREEAGVEGRILRLLGAESTVSELYGELLVVTFEVERTGGEERPGDDAAAVGWFPLGSLPPLAFAPNESAAAACAEAHRDEWAIQDSFRELQAEHGGGMLSDVLVAGIRANADAIVAGWVEEVLTNPTTTSYRRVDAARMRERAAAALSQFARWLAGAEEDDGVRAFYRAVGGEHRRRGFGLAEVVSSLTLFRKHVWTFARGQAVFARPIDAYRVLELDRRFALFFDRAVYQAARGFEERGPRQEPPPDR